MVAIQAAVDKDIPGGATTTPPPTITPPLVSLTSPSGSSSYTAPATLNLSATASDSDGIAKVEFFNGSTLLTTISTAPYVYNWTNVPAGTYVLTAKATDGKGASTTSNPATATVSSLNANTPPAVSLTSPSATVTYTAPATLVLSATATDSNGISRVEFLRDGVLVATERYAPYSVSLGSVAAGAYSFSARAVDTLGAVSASLPVNVTVQAAGAPPPTAAYDITSLVLVNASNGAAIRTLQPNETISLKNLGVPSISIQALGSSGTKSVRFQSAPNGVSRVENSAPWAFLGNSGSVYTAWAPVAGTYSITATGYSGGNASGTAGKPLNVTIQIVP